MRTDRRASRPLLTSAFCLLPSAFICVLLALPAAADTFRIHPGHDPRWTQPSFDDASWGTTTFDQIRDTGEITMRQTVDLTKLRRSPSHPVGIYVAGMYSYEVWWDGERIARGGVVGRTKAEEVPGPIEAHFQLPDRLATPGPHSLVIRSSAFHRGFDPLHGYWTVYVADYDFIVNLRKASSSLALIALSGIVITAIFAFALYFLTGRALSFLLLGALCVATGGLLMAEAWRELFGYTYDWQIVRLRSVLSLSWLVGQLLVALVVTRFPHRWSRAVLLATALVSLAVIPIPRGWDPKSALMLAISIAVSLGWTIFAAVRRMHGSVLALIGITGGAVVMLVWPYSFLDNGAYFAFDFLFACLLCSHALEVRRAQQEKTRLQLEMLRRHMQPHFLMNTLTALAEWIEQEPKTAVRLIESLADEVRILTEMSNRRVVSAEDELRLCRSHLANMSMRKEVAYELEVDGVDDDRPVPPALFHTLVENAITHGSANGGRVTMRLTAHASRDRVYYVFESPVGEENGTAERGTGTRYIEARLREAWGEAWSFRQGRVGGLWRAEIEVPA